MITVDNRTGDVSVVTSRYVVVRGLDGVEAIVPNEMLVTTTVLNHSYTSKDVKVGIPRADQLRQRPGARDAPDDRARRQASRASCSGALAPVVNVLQFADNGIDLELAVWINDPENGQGNLKIGAEHRASGRRFADNGIRIPYPQREVRIIGWLARRQAARRRLPADRLYWTVGRSPVRRQPS